MGLTQVSTDGVKNDAITKTKIPANQIEASELADNAVDTNAIANNAVTAGKLASGVQTTINNNADNRVITGSGTANTLNGEANLFFDGSQLGVGTTSPYQYSIAHFESTNGITLAGSSQSRLLFRHTGGGTDLKMMDIQSSNGIMKFRKLADSTTATDRMVIDASGRVGIGTNSPSYPLEVRAASGDANMRLKTDGTGTGDDTIFRMQVAGTTQDNFIYFGDSEDSNAGQIIYNHDNNILRFFTNAGERLRIHSGGGISFNGDTAAANALDDYEEGTYTITPLNDGGATLTSNRANYTKIGNMVRISGSFTITATNGTNNNQARFSLPFTSSVNSYYVAHGNTITSTGYTGVVLSATIENSAPYMIFNPSVGMSSRSWSQLGNNRFDFDIVYRV